MLQHAGPSYRQSFPPQAKRQMILEGIAFTRLSLAWEYDGLGTGTCGVMEDRTETNSKSLVLYELMV